MTTAPEAVRPSQKQQQLAVAFIGVGTMGWPMAGHIRKAGFPLTVYDLDHGKARAFAKEHGCSAASNLADLAGAGIVVTMLPTGRIVRQVLLQAEQGAFLNKVRSGTIVVDMGSSDPPGTRQLGAALARRGVTLLDAPVSGTVVRAGLGTLTIMLGGDDAGARERARPLLETMGERIFETGPLGSGHAAKTLNNFITATTYAALSEALLTAGRFGLDPATLVEILGVSTGQSFIADKFVKEQVLTGRFASGFSLGLLAKDVRIAAELGESVGLNVPFMRLTNQRWELARDRVGPDLDSSEAIKAWDEDN